METLGRITAGLLVAAGTVAAIVAVASVPDIKRYLKIRAM